MVAIKISWFIALIIINLIITSATEDSPTLQPEQRGVFESQMEVCKIFNKFYVFMHFYVDKVVFIWYSYFCYTKSKSPQSLL